MDHTPHENVVFLASIVLRAQLRRGHAPTRETIGEAIRRVLAAMDAKASTLVHTPAVAAELARRFGAEGGK